MLSVTSTHAQIGNLGIYGSAPEAIRANVFYARLDPDVPITAQCEGCETYLPLNGLKNFNFWYTSDGTGFMAGGAYKVSYWNASLTTRYGNYDYVTYSPNSDHTNGVSVRTFNPVPIGQPTPLGIHAVVLGYNSTGTAVLPVKNVLVNTLTYTPVYAKTNGNGFFSIYYDGGITGGFLSYGPHFDILISGFSNGCHYFYIVPRQTFVWAPLTNANSPFYFVTDAEVSLDIPILTCGSITDEG